MGALYWFIYSFEMLRLQSYIKKHQLTLVSSNHSRLYVYHVFACGVNILLHAYLLNLYGTLYLELLSPEVFSLLAPFCQDVVAKILYCCNVLLPRPRLVSILTAHGPVSFALWDYLLDQNYYRWFLVVCVLLQNEFKYSFTDYKSIRHDIIRYWEKLIVVI